MIELFHSSYLSDCEVFRFLKQVNLEIFRLTQFLRLDKLKFRAVDRSSFQTVLVTY